MPCPQLDPKSGCRGRGELQARALHYFYGNPGSIWDQKARQEEPNSSSAFGVDPCSIHSLCQGSFNNPGESAVPAPSLTVPLQPMGFFQQISEGIPWTFPSCPDSSELHTSPGLLCIPDRLVLQEPSSENSSRALWECSGLNLTGLSLTGLSLTCLSLTGTMGIVLGVTSCRRKGTTRPCVPGKKIIIDTCLGFILPAPIKGEFWSSCKGAREHRPGFGIPGFGKLRLALCRHRGCGTGGGQGGSARVREMKELGREQSLEDGGRNQKSFIAKCLPAHCPQKMQPLPVAACIPQPSQNIPCSSPHLSFLLSCHFCGVTLL